MARPGTVRKNLRLTQEKLDRAKEILGTTTDTETVESALDLVIFRDDVAQGIRAIGGSGAIDDIYRDDRTA